MLTLQGGNMDFDAEVRSGKRFRFGKNWKRFLTTLNDSRILAAQKAISEMIQSDVKGKRIIDVGSGSGLSSLAFYNLGAKVFSFDYDPESVACTQYLKSKYNKQDSNWQVSEGSILDKDFISSLGKFDIVYSWGVLHHTGNMWEAIENATNLLGKSGVVFIAIYNNQGLKSLLWKRVKKVYCSSIIGKLFVSSVFMPYFFSRMLCSSIINRKNFFKQYRENRGMSVIYDWYDWLGGYPFETAKVEDIFAFFAKKGFVLTNIRTTNSAGNNQYVFAKK